jgi:hypothetical protein
MSVLFITKCHRLEPELADEVGFVRLMTLLPDSLDIVTEAEVIGLRLGSTVRP